MGVSCRDGRSPGCTEANRRVNVSVIVDRTRGACPQMGHMLCSHFILGRHWLNVWADGYQAKHTIATLPSRTEVLPTRTGGVTSLEHCGIAGALVVSRWAPQVTSPQTLPSTTSSGTPLPKLSAEKARAELNVTKLVRPLNNVRYVPLRLGLRAR